ncbi:MAG: lysoplasmalogenase [Chitinophagaceae bacterium]|nr:MAG: lysoplasmalogenase [Chitinophagaceae bacterium]
MQGQPLFSTFHKSTLFLLIVSLLHLSGAILESEVSRYLTKPLLMPILIFGFYFSLTKPLNRFSLFILVGLIFSWFGDLFLMFEGPLFFISGLISFFITHILYCIAFYQDWKNDISTTPVYKNPALLLPFLIFYGLLIYVLFPYLDEMLIPVLAYGFIITLMAVFALNRKGVSTSFSFTYIFIGSILFIISDTIIAVNKFYTDVYLSEFFIMLTYISAQFFIVSGSLRQKQTIKL